MRKRRDAVRGKACKMYYRCQDGRDCALEAGAVAGVTGRAGAASSISRVAHVCREDLAS